MNHLKDYGCRVVYVLPQKADKCHWFSNASKLHEILLIDDNPSKTVSQLARFFFEVNPSIIHTHFDGYDMPVVKAVRKLGMEENVKVVWHLHDHLSFMNNIAKKFYQVYGFLMHYGKYAKNVFVIGVGEEITYFANTWYKLWNNGNFKRLAIIPNAIDSTRITTLKNNEKVEKSFLAFGGRNVSKRIDLLLNAASILNGGKNLENKNRVDVYITRGTDTDEVVTKVFGNNVPDWCHVVEQRENINELFEMADCFVSCSDAETFSYAICEATIANMPVIQSDIDGTMWNAESKSAFLFKQGDAASCAEAMKRYMDSDVNELQKECLKTREHNQRCYGLDTWCKRVINFYEHL